MIDTTVFQDKKAVYYTLGCKLNFAETSSIGKILKEAGVRTARRGERAEGEEGKGQRGQGFFHEGCSSGTRFFAGTDGETLQSGGLGDEALWRRYPVGSGNEYPEKSSVRQEF